MESCVCLFRHQSLSLSSSHWGRWPTCLFPAFRQEACCGFLTWRQQILFTFCLWPSPEPCSSSWRSETFHQNSGSILACDRRLDVFMFSLNACHFLVGCRVWYWQSQPASYEDCVQGHAFYHPPSHDQLPHGQFVVRCHHSTLCSSQHAETHPFLSSNKFQAVFTYWFTSNCFSLGQVALLRHPLIRDRLRIPEKIKHPSSALPQNEGFIESMKKGEHPHRHSVLVLLKGLIDLILEKLWGQRIYICSPRLEKCSAGPTAGGKGKEDQKSPGSSSQRSV